MAYSAWSPILFNAGSDGTQGFTSRLAYDSKQAIGHFVPGSQDESIPVLRRTHVRAERYDPWCQEARRCRSAWSEATQMGWTVNKGAKIGEKVVRMTMNGRFSLATQHPESFVASPGAAWARLCEYGHEYGLKDILTFWREGSWLQRGGRMGTLQRLAGGRPQRATKPA